MIKRIFIAFLLVLPTCLMSQISVAVDTELDSIKYADEVVLNYKLNIPQGVNLTSLDFSILKKIENAAFEQDSVNFDEFMDVSIIDGGAFGISDNNLIVTKPSNGEIPREGNVKVRISSIGAFLLPTPKLGHLSSVQEIPLQRKPLFVLPRNVVELNENRDIIREKVSWWDYGKYIAFLLGFAAFVYGMYRFFDRKKAKGNAEVEFIEKMKEPAHKIALEHLASLKAKELWQNGKEKEYHSELTHIMRQYIEDRYEVPALEMTTSQLSRSMTEQGIEKTVIQKLVDILQIADKVKFAKGKTGPQINETFWKESEAIVLETMKTENTDTEE